MGDVYAAIGFCIIPIIIIWPISYVLMKKQLKRELTTGVQAIALVGSHLTTSMIVALTGMTSSLGVAFVVAIIVSPLSIFLASKKYA